MLVSNSTSSSADSAPASPSSPSCHPTLPSATSCYTAIDSSRNSCPPDSPPATPSLPPADDTPQVPAPNSSFITHPSSFPPSPAPGRDILPPPRGESLPVLRDRFHPLNPQQYRAIELLVAGLTDADVAADVGVHRVTVTRWRLYHILFQAEFSRRRNEVFSSASDELRLTLSRAVRTLKKQLRAPNALTAFRAARGLLTLAHQFAPPDCPTDPHAIIENHARTKHIETKTLDPRYDAVDDDDRAAALYDLAWLHENTSFDPPDH